MYTVADQSDRLTPSLIAVCVLRFADEPRLTNGLIGCLGVKMARLMLSLAMLLSASLAQAVSSEFSLLLDLDGNSASGCEVSSEDGLFSGANAILTTRVETDGLDAATVTAVERRDCIDPDSNLFGPPQTVSSGGWPVGIGNGEGGFNVIETFLPISPGTAFNTLRMAVMASDEFGNTSAMLTTLPGGSGPILLDGIPPIPVPLGGRMILLLMASLLLLIGAIVISRRGRLTLTALLCLSAGTVAGAACVLDGEIFNWDMADRLAQSGASDPDNGVDLRALFASYGDGYTRLCFRIDAALIFSTAPEAVDDDYIVVESALLDVPVVDGLIGNDEPGIPAAVLVSFGGGDLGGTVADYSAGSSVALGVDGILAVNADGSFQFRAANGQSGTFQFQYRIENLIGSSDATVTIVVQTVPVATADVFTVITGKVLAFSAPGVLVNDSGLPDPLVVSFGGGDAGGTVNANAAGTSLALAPDGSLSINPDGSLELIPPSGLTGDFEFNYRIENAAGADTAEVRITINQPPAITSANELSCEVGDSCSFTLTADGYPAPGFDLPDLPAGLSLNGGSGELTGTPAAGTGAVYPLTLTASNGIAPDAIEAFILTINEAPSITSGDEIGCILDQPCSFTFEAGGYPAPAFELPGLPDGLTLDATTGQLGGAPAEDGVFNLTLTAINASGSDSQELVLTIGSPPIITSAAGFSCVVGSVCEFDFVADGVPNPTINLAGTLPAGVVFNAATETLEGTPAAGTGAEYSLTVTASNSVDPDAEQTFVLTINEAPAITSGDTLACEVGAACDFTFTADGFPDPTFSLPGLPAGLSLDPATGVLSGTPDAGTGAVYPLTLTVANGIAPDADQAFTLTVGEAPTITSEATLTCEVGQACAFTFTADGFPAPDFTLPGLPSSLTLNGVTGALSGTPDAGTGAAYVLTLTAANGIAPDADQTFTLTINEAPTITSGDSLDCEILQPCEFVFTATGFPEPEFDLPGLPTGVVLDPLTGVLSGTPDATAGGVYNLNLTASNTINPDATQGFTLSVGSPPEITSADNVQCTVGNVCTFMFTADGVPAPTITVIGGLPMGVSFNAGTSALEGTPGAGSGGAYPLTVEAANGFLPNASQTFTLTVTELPAPQADPTGGIPGNSSPGSTPYHGSFNTPLTVSSADGVLINDALGFPAAAISTPTPVASNGSVALNLDGSFTYTPNAGFTGLDSFEYCLANTAGTACANVSVAIGIRPAAPGATYPTALIGNVAIDTQVASQLTVPAAGDGISVVLQSSNNADALVRGNRTYVFNPNAGHTGAASLTYRVSNGFGFVDGVISFTVGNGIWFVDNAQPAGNGRLGSPFNALATAAGQANGWPIFIATGSGNYTGGVSLSASRTLIGHPSAASLETITGLTAPADSVLPTASTSRPVIVNPGGIGLTLGSNNRLYSLQISNSNVGIRGIDVNGLILNNVAVTNNGSTLGHHGIFLTDPAGMLDFTNVTASGNFQNNVLIDDSNNTGGPVTLTVTGGTYANNNSDIGDNGMLINVRGSAVWGTSMVAGATFSMNRVVGLLVLAGDNAQITGFNVVNNTFQGGGAEVGQQIGLDMSKALTSTMSVRVANNTFLGHNAQAVNFFSAAGEGTGGAYNARIENNSVGSAALFGSGSRIGNCMRILMQGDSVDRVLVNGNTLRQCPNGRGIEVVGRNGTGGLDVTITNNQANNDFVTTPQNGGFSLASIFVQSNCVGTCNMVRADIRGNTVPATPPNGEIVSGQLGLIRTSTSTLQMVDTTAPISGTCATELAGTNTGSTAVSGDCTLIAGPINTPP